MIYKAIGVNSDGNPAGTTIAFITFTVTGKQWQYQLLAQSKIVYNEQWQQQLQSATALCVADYIQLHQHFGEYIGQLINSFIEQHSLQHQVQLIVYNGHNIINLPLKKLFVQLGDGACIAAATGLAVIGNLTAIDIALGGKAANIFSKALLLLSASEEKSIDNTNTLIPYQHKDVVLTALLGVIRWREEATVLPLNGSLKASIGGAVWIGSEA